ncbi:hypothetical protein [Rhizobium rhizogenes]|uniref:hypothetical protein n=1 Tax=Rhizobium rhizogenes TaxID=359 RepID=UPI0015716096|nr:hypothetical protein [Rhizobium rhizogenes]
MAHAEVWELSKTTIETMQPQECHSQAPQMIEPAKDQEGKKMQANRRSQTQAGNTQQGEFGDREGGN